MHLRHRWLALVVLLFPAAASADDHFADWYGGIKLMAASSLVGVHTAVALNPFKGYETVSLVADLGFADGSDDGRDVTKVTALSGLRFSSHLNNKMMPFAQVLLGSFSTDGAGRDGHNLAMAVGGGLEIGFGQGVQTSGHLSTRWALRVHTDVIFQRGGSDAFRLSGGIVYRLTR